MVHTKSYNISKRLVYEAYLRVKANKGCAGVDGQSLEDFSTHLKDNLYKLWNRMSSGSYHPQAVKWVEIPKASGGTRPLGIPTVTDRIAQMVVKMLIEPELEEHFHTDSYGYRPHKSAHQALQQVNVRCRQRAWVLDMDIKGFFDAINHNLLMRAVKKHVTEDWQLLYIRRWLEAPVQLKNGCIEQRTEGTPQGGVISPLLANLFLHYAFDMWMVNNRASIQFSRYADDVICHCVTEEEAVDLHAALKARFEQCGLALHPTKTKIVYCKSWKYKGNHSLISFDFLGFTFRPRLIKTRAGKALVCFLPAISQASAKRIRDDINSWNWPRWTVGDVYSIVYHAQRKIRGWMNYYGVFGYSVLENILFHFDLKLSRWAKRKCKRLKSLMQAGKWVKAFKQRNRYLLAHWNLRWK